MFGLQIAWILLAELVRGKAYLVKECLGMAGFEMVCPWMMDLRMVCLGIVCVGVVCLGMAHVWISDYETV